MKGRLKGNILITVIVMGFLLSVLLVPAVTTTSRLLKVQGGTTSFVAGEEVLSSALDYTKYLIANNITSGSLSLPQGTVQVTLNNPTVVGDVYQYYDVLVVFSPQSSGNKVWTAKLVYDGVTQSSWIVSVTG